MIAESDAAGYPTRITEIVRLFFSGARFHAVYHRIAQPPCRFFAPASSL
jgi:hypothetical protein